MGEGSKIGWTDNTHNEWEGCSEVGPGCFGCYAKARDLRLAGGVHWGPGAPRRLLNPHTRNQLYRWNWDAHVRGIHPNVFCGSLCDVFDNEVPDEWRTNPFNTGLFDKLRECKNLRPQLVTKRIGNALKMLPLDWTANFRHCGIIATMVNQEEIDRDMPKLAKIRKMTSWTGLSIEPQLESVSLRGWADAIDWVITGGESWQPAIKDHRPRPYYLRWARELIEWGRVNHVAVFVKQVGSKPLGFTSQPIHNIRSKAGTVMNEWPEEIRQQQFPDVEWLMTRNLDIAA